MSESALQHVAMAIAFGMAAQSVAVRFGVPSIVLLLVTGVAIGPDGIGLLDPEALGAARGDLVALAVTIILFEGALGLRAEDLRKQQRSLTLLLTAGAAISMGVGAVAAHGLLGMPWQTALLYGSLMIVTGPTVVTPLLARLTLDRSVRELLISEGVLIDPVGAIVAIVTVEYVLGAAGMLATGGLVFGSLAIGAVTGVVAGIAMGFVLQRGWVSDDLRNPVVLASVLAAAVLADRLSAHAGFMAAVSQGVVLANFGVPEIRRLKTFNEEMTVVLLSFLFVLLAADLPMSEVRGLGIGALLVVGALIWGGRPLAVFVCTAGSELSVRQRLFVSWVCPRGIVAASVAALFRLLLEEAGLPGGAQLEALVFVTVGVTVALQGLTTGSVARLLGVDVPALVGTMIVGADYFGRMLARLLVAYGRPAVLVDRNREFCRLARAEGLAVHCGDALSVEVLEEAGARYVDTVVAATTNDELNTLVAGRVLDNFKAERILSVVPPAERAEAEKAAHPFPGNFHGIAAVNRHLYTGRLRLTEYEVGEGVGKERFLTDLPFGKDEFALFLKRRERVFFAASDQTLVPGDRVLCATVAEGESALGSVLKVVRAVDVQSPPALTSRDEPA